MSIIEKYKKYTSFLLLFAISVISCNESIHNVKNYYHYQPPIYDLASIVPTSDTLSFSLGENMYNDIGSFNIFKEKDTDYVCFYDRRSQFIYFYYLLNQQLYKSISLKKFFKNSRFYKTSVFVRNSDSIFIINNLAIYIFDSSGRKKQKIDFPSSPKNSAVEFDNHKLPILLNDSLFAISRNRVDYKSLTALRRWKVMYKFNLKKGTVEQLYHLPLIYQKQFYGNPFLEYNFCYNGRGKLVFSFPADTLLYETDLDNYNHSYFARSKTQKGIIPPVEKEKTIGAQSRKEYNIRDSYGAIFYNSIKKYYLRLARHKISSEEFDDQKKPTYTLLILNENFRIIGESNWPKNVDFNSIFFTSDGQLFARTKFKDEQAINFVRLEYKEASTYASKKSK